MQHNPGVPALIRLYAELAGRIPDKRINPDCLRRDMWHVEKVIKMLEPSFDVGTIRPYKRPKSNKWFPHRKAFRTALDMLRGAEKPLTAREIAERLFQQRGVDNPPPATMEKMVCNIRDCLKNNRGKAVRRVGEEAPHRWTIR